VRRHAASVRGELPIAVMIMGTVARPALIAYVLLALDGRNQLGWNTKRFLWVLVMAVLPTAAFFAERSVKAEADRAARPAEPVTA